MADTPHDFWCRVPTLETLNMSADRLRNLTVPFDVESGRFSQCTRYAIDWEAVLNGSSTFGDWQNESVDESALVSMIVPNVTWPVEECREGWVYNRSIVSSSIVIDVSTWHGYSKQHM